MQEIAIKSRISRVLPLLFLAVACSSGSPKEKTDASGEGHDAIVEESTMEEGTARDDFAGQPDGFDQTTAEDTLTDLDRDGQVPEDGDLPSLPDVDWESLPTLPQGKEFSTRYAAGVAVRDITPDHQVFMGGFGFCGGDANLCRKSEGVHDPLYVTVVAIADTQSGEVVMFAGVDSVGLVHFDIDLMHTMVQRRLYEEMGVYFYGPRLMIGASHSHATPDTTGLWGPMFGYGRDEEYITMLRDRVVDAAVEAFQGLRDVHIVWAVGSSPNSTDGTPPVVKDEDLFVLKGTDPNGKTVFTLTRWSSHPTAYGSKNNGISADYVGTFRKRMQDELGGVAVFMNGCLGGTYPDRPSECGLKEEAFPDGFKDLDLSPKNFMKVTCTGHQVADNAMKALQENAHDLAETGIRFVHAEFGFHPENELLMLAAKYASVPFEWVDVSDPMSQMITEFSIAIVGDLTFITTPGESFPAFGKALKEVIEKAGLINPVVLGITQDWLGYLLTEEQWSDPKLSYHQGLSPGRKILPAMLEKLDEVLSL